MSILDRPESIDLDESLGRYEKFNLKENPFPSEPAVNMKSDDIRINGGIFEMEIRRDEFNRVLKNFIKVPQNDRTHYRLGYIVDTSYIGRGNGKSAFLINLANLINEQFCLDLSEKVNKCFGVCFSPQPGGRTKLFSAFVDQLFDSFITFNIFNISLMLLRLEAIQHIQPDLLQKLNINEYEKISMSMITEDWYTSNNIEFQEVDKKMKENHPELLSLDIFRGNYLFSKIVTQDDFIDFYVTLKKKEEKYQFIFTDLVRFFRIVGFNGGYIFVDDYERIPDFQSARQKKDFALELRSILYDGLFESAKTGFFVFFLVLHAGVSRLISESWSASGMDHRSPLEELSHKHIIPFNKLDSSHAALLLKKYISEYRIEKTEDDLFPFTNEVVSTISEKSENNAAKILKSAYELLEKAVGETDVIIIDPDFEKKYSSIYDRNVDDSEDFDSTKSIDLLEKAKGE